MKKIISLLLVMVLIISVGDMNVFAATEDKSSYVFDINDYEQYTIDFKCKCSKSRSTDNTIDEAVQYVESLNLTNGGFDYLEEACLSELEKYKADDIVLDSYTVLVPKAKTKYYYGTYSGNDFYYENTSVANLRRETNGVAKSASNATKWNNWILGVTDLAMCFANLKWSIPYTMIRTVTGVSGTTAVHNGSYNQHVEQFTNTVTRSIYRERGTTYDLCYQDQSSSLRVNLYFCPVGTAFSSDYIYIGTSYNGSIKATEFSKDQILAIANTQSNHGSKVTYSVSSHRVEEQW